MLAKAETINQATPTSANSGDMLSMLSEVETAFLRSALALGTRPGFACPYCGHHCMAGALYCPRCHTMFNSGGETQRLDTRPQTGLLATRPLGAVFVESEVGLEISGQLVVLPDQPEVVIGRLSDLDHVSKPDVNLNAFRADALGVSREHIRITRSESMVYVADLGSSNGTYLNGRRLQPLINRLVRSGDELRLSKLILYVKFLGTDSPDVPR